MAALTEMDALLTAALQLPVAEPARLAERLLASIDGIETEGGDPVDPEYMAELVAECQRRLEQYRRGETTAIDGDEVYRRLLAKNRA